MIDFKLNQILTLFNVLWVFISSIQTWRKQWFGLCFAFYIKCVCFQGCQSWLEYFYETVSVTQLPSEERRLLSQMLDNIGGHDKQFFLCTLILTGAIIDELLFCYSEQIYKIEFDQVFNAMQYNLLFEVFLKMVMFFLFFLLPWLNNYS